MKAGSRQPKLFQRLSVKETSPWEYKIPGVQPCFFRDTGAISGVNKNIVFTIVVNQMSICCFSLQLVLLFLNDRSRNSGIPYLFLCLFPNVFCGCHHGLCKRKFLHFVFSRCLENAFLKDSLHVLAHYSQCGGVTKRVQYVLSEWYRAGNDVYEELGKFWLWVNDGVE